jgi:putative GTP pyrophosphokinase
MPSCVPDLGNKELIDEFERLDGEIAVMNMLVNLAIHEWIGDRAESDHIILQITKGKELKLHQFDLELEASKRLLELEKEFPEDDIVLVGAQTVEEVISAFRNYFNDVREFIRLITEALKILLGTGAAADEKMEQA